MAGPDPGILLADGAQPHTVLRVERSLLVRAGQDDVLALGKVADATRIKGKELVLSDLKQEAEGKKDVAVNRSSSLSRLNTHQNPSSGVAFGVI